MNKITPPEDDALARELIAALLREDSAFIIQKMDKRALGETPGESLKLLYEYIDHAPIRSVELVGFNMAWSSKRRESRLLYQLEFPRSWYTAELAIVSDDGRQKVIRFHLNRMTASLAETNRFTFRGKGAIHYVILLNVIGLPVFILYALIQCVRTRIKRKWLWIPFILIGIGEVTANWTTGQIRLQPLAVHLLGAGFARWGLYGPWMVSVAFPLGAVLFLKKRRKLRAAMLSDAAQTPDVREDPSTTAGEPIEVGSVDMEPREDRPGACDDE